MVKVSDFRPTVCFFPNFIDIISSLKRSAWTPQFTVIKYRLDLGTCIRMHTPLNVQRRKYLIDFENVGKNHSETLNNVYSAISPTFLKIVLFSFHLIVSRNEQVHFNIWRNDLDVNPEPGEEYECGESSCLGKLHALFGWGEQKVTALLIHLVNGTSQRGHKSQLQRRPLKCSKKKKSVAVGIVLSCNK